MTTDVLTLSAAKDAAAINEQLSHQILQEAIDCGVREFCICAGSRNAPFVITLANNPHIQQYFWPEERSAAFFALGRSRLTNRPVAVITTSGTAVGEMLPAAMEAYYTGVPLLFLTADRPRRYRGTGAPQTAEHVGIFGQYAIYSQDIAQEDECRLATWDHHGVAHINVCFEEPLGKIYQNQPSLAYPSDELLPNFEPFGQSGSAKLDNFFQNVKNPLIIVSTIKAQDKEPVVNFLLKLQAPICLEGISNLREDPRLQHLAITRTQNLWPHAAAANYAIDGVLRLGGVPTIRLWRDLESKADQLQVCSLNDVPFSGLSWGGIICAPVGRFLDRYRLRGHLDYSHSAQWIAADRVFQQKLEQLFIEESNSEVSLLKALSQKIPSKALVYLGNSLPIREWDLAACRSNHAFNIMANRGLSGIDGQVSSFLGLSQSQQENWGIFGDLTMLYDMAGPWILSQLTDVNVNIVVVNNSGGQIFSRMYSQEQFLNRHQLHFDSLAAFWKLHYERWNEIPETILPSKSRLIEVVPDEASTNRFWQKLSNL